MARRCIASEVADFNGGKHGGITAYRVNPADGGLTQLNGWIRRGGAGVSLIDAGRAVSAGGQLRQRQRGGFPDRSGRRTGAASSVQQQQGPAGAAKPAAAVNGSFAISDRNGPHAHMIASDPSGKFAFSTDLGLDRIYQWRFDAASGRLTPNDPPWIAASSAGAGPRHFVFHPDGETVLLVNEEASTLTSYRFDRQKVL